MESFRQVMKKNCSRSRKSIMQTQKGRNHTLSKSYSWKYSCKYVKAKNDDFSFDWHEAYLVLLMGQIPKCWTSSQYWKAYTFSNNYCAEWMPYFLHQKTKKLRYALRKTRRHAKNASARWNSKQYCRAVLCKALVTSKVITATKAISVEEKLNVQTLHSLLLTTWTIKSEMIFHKAVEWT